MKKKIVVTLITSLMAINLMACSKNAETPVDDASAVNNSVSDSTATAKEKNDLSKNNSLDELDLSFCDTEILEEEIEKICEDLEDNENRIITLKGYLQTDGTNNSVIVYTTDENQNDSSEDEDSIIIEFELNDSSSDLPESGSLISLTGKIKPIIESYVSSIEISTDESGESVSNEVNSEYRYFSLTDCDYEIISESITYSDEYTSFLMMNEENEGETISLTGKYHYIESKNYTTIMLGDNSYARFETSDDISVFNEGEYIKVTGSFNYDGVGIIKDATISIPTDEEITNSEYITTNEDSEISVSYASDASSESTIEISSEE